MVSTPTRSPEPRLHFKLRGGARELFEAHDREILMEGPAGTGKTRAILELLHLLAWRFPGMRGLIVRKHSVTLAKTALVTLNEKVLHGGDHVRFFGGSKHEPAAYRYPNGSRIVVGGMDDASKILSSEYDIIYVNEATELMPNDWEMLTTRLRNGVLEHQRIIADCNPVQSRHWLNQRADQGLVRRILSRFEDNPAYFDDDGQETRAGQEYLATLDVLSGVRYERLRLGLWTGTENAIYPHFDRRIHVRPLPEGLVFKDGAFGVDYGRRHKAAATAISVDQYGRRWVRECWAEPDIEHGLKTMRNVGRLRDFYKLRRGRVDPNQDALIGLIDAQAVHLAEGPRQARIDKTSRLFGTFPGGRVPPRAEELFGRENFGPWLEEDSPGLLLVEGAPGIDELADEIEGYHYVRVTTERRDEDVVARIDEDRVASMEYAIEELDEDPLPFEGVVAGTVGSGERGPPPPLRPDEFRVMRPDLREPTPQGRPGRAVPPARRR